MLVEKPNKKSMQKYRQSNFELLRLVCMLMVMTGHASGYVEEKDLVGTFGVSKLLVNQLCLISVDVFVMISGWFGIKASIKGVAKFLFQIWFLASLCYFLFMALGLPVSFTKDLLPYLLFGSGYWFAVSYLILYALSPVLNAFLEHASQKEVASTLAAFFLAAFVYGFLLNTGCFNFGFSPLSFIGLYLLAGYVRRYSGKLFSFSKRTDFFIYLCVSVLSALMFWFGYKWFGMGFHLNHNDSPLAIIASLYFLLLFSKTHFQNRFVNWLAVSSFAIYLIHENALISPYFHQVFHHLSETVPLGAYYPAMLGILIVMGMVFILVDKLRLFAWNLLERIVIHFKNHVK